ncbi:MAG TPA: inorganic phosphate transporter [Candidatus Avisuccinivibrio pullicola]|nr:inorganic phosphate transporter [Candidatus Avisuccinivibrio pullicola]
MLESMFTVLVVFLVMLACIDLFVGVSNDAVNFLNSAVGCRIAPLQIILIVASAGVLFGATFSSGMMEVARSGVFHPELFNFHEIMLIFFGVMVGDVLLLNLFNALGLPTSTTVSIIFDLLGAAVCASLFKLHYMGLSFGEVFEYIKTDRAATIVSAILVSVVVAFIAGMVVQFICRLLFTFRFERTVKYFGGLYCGFSITSIIYFLVMKGAKGASFMKPEYIAFMEENTTTILVTLFIVISILSQVLVLMKVNIFRIIILAGTFALAFSFAGNDLVNFIGVPLAALDSFETWIASGLSADNLLMGSLNENSHVSTWYLFAAGAIMVVTLWTSKKAHRVIQTSINLSSSTRGEHEQFGASTPGRVVTRFGLGISRATYHLMPRTVLGFIALRYRKAPVIKGQVQLPFDYVRASINLVIAAILISSATALKLPLSTTYVTFMVAMGSSFADGAWDRESAVYRISGVITVIAGWFMTGICAFTCSGLVTFLLFAFGTPAVIILMLLVVAIIIKTNFTRTKASETVSSLIEAGSDNNKILHAVSNAVPNGFDNNVECLRRCFDAFFGDNEMQLRRARNKASNIVDAISRERAEYYTLALEKNRGTSKEAGGIDARHFFYLAFSNMREASKSIRYAIDQAVVHVANRHTIFEGEMRQSLYDLLERIGKMSQDLRNIAADPSTVNVEAIIRHGKKLNRDVDRCQINLVDLIGRQHVSMHSSEMYLTFLQTMRDLANRYVAVAMQNRALSQIVAGAPVDSQVQSAQMQTTVTSAAITTGTEETLQNTPAAEDEEHSAESAPQPVSEPAAVAEETSVSENKPQA